MACDYLTIKGSAMPSEWAFSSGGMTGTLKCNCLDTDTFQALQLLKGAYQNGHISAHSEAQKHAVNLSDAFKTNGNGELDMVWKGKGKETNSEWLS